MALKKRSENLWHQVELIQIEGVPGNHRVRLKIGFDLFAVLIYGLVYIFEFAAGCVDDNLWPRLVRLAKRDCIGMARSAVTAQGLVRHLGYVRTAHHDKHPSGPDGVGHPVCLGRHARHGADANQGNSVLFDVFNELSLVHRLSISIYKEYFVSGRSNRLKQKHPKVWHKIASHTIVWIVEEDFHGSVSLFCEPGSLG